MSEIPVVVCQNATRQIKIFLNPENVHKGKFQCMGTYAEPGGPRGPCPTQIFRTYSHSVL